MYYCFIVTGKMEDFGGGERGRQEKGDLEERVLRLWGDLERGHMGGVWVRREGMRGRGKRGQHGMSEERLRQAADRIQ